MGAVISPLLSNIYLQALDRAFADGAHGTLVRYADDFVVICTSEAQARAAQQLAGAVMVGLGLDLHPDKTKVVDLREGREGLTFSAVTSEPVCRAGCWSAASAATTSSAGPHSER